MYEDLVAAAQRSSEAAVSESQARVDMAVERSEQADKQATEATKAVGDKWTSRIQAMRRRAADRSQAKSTEMNLGHEDGPHPSDSNENDELTSLTEPSATTPQSAVDSQKTPPFGLPQQSAGFPAQGAGFPGPSADTYGRHAQQPEPDRFLPQYEQEEERPQPRFAQPTRRAAPPRRAPRPTDDDDEDYSGTSWLEGR